MAELSPPSGDLLVLEARDSSYPASVSRLGAPSAQPIARRISSSANIPGGAWL
jgi:hypothetical protein